MPRLDFFVDYKLFLRFVLEAESQTIGRSSGCEVQLNDAKVSRRHAQITVDGEGAYWIENLSSNGTRLNAAMLEVRTMLNPGDRVYIGDYVMVYHPEDAPPLKDEDQETLLEE